MTRKQYRYSLNRRDAKIAGVCSTLGEKFGIDPTFVRIGFVATLFLISFKLTLVAYAALGIWLAIQRKRDVDGRSGLSEFERMEQAGKRRPTVHGMRTELDENDRRMMAIDHHLSKQNDELAREIEALREDK
ncbi:MAG: PspC domain-containing protein [Sphingomicrobium sp.]